MNLISRILFVVAGFVLSIVYVSSSLHAYDDNGYRNNLMRSRDALLQQKDNLLRQRRNIDYYLQDVERSLRDIEYALRRQR